MNKTKKLSFTNTIKKILKKKQSIKKNTKFKNKTKKNNVKKTKTLIKENKLSGNNCVDLLSIPELKDKDVEYLKNPICKFIPLYKFNLNVKKNVVSACFFKMRKGGYKDFNKYLKGVEVLAKKTKLELGNNFIVKLFIDLSIYNDKEIMDKLNKIENLEMVLYLCNKFCVGEHHLGTFGTFIRMFPCFDLPNNDTNRVIVQDIDHLDSPKKIFDNYNFIRTLYTEKQLDTVQLYIKGRPQHLHGDNNRNYIINNVMFPYVVFSRIIVFKKLNFSSLNKYLNKVFFTKQHKTPYLITKAIRKKKCDEYICFGIDEEYLNAILIPSMIKNKESLLINMTVNKTAPLFFIQNYLLKKSKFQNVIKNLLSDIIDTNSMEFNEIYKYFKKLCYDKENGELYSKQNYSTELKQLLKNIDNLYEQMLKNKDNYLANLDSLKIYLKFKNLLKINYINGYNNKLKKIILD